jgi:putative transposase
MLIPKKQRETRIDFKAPISVSKQCKVLGLKRNFLYHSAKGESEEDLKIMLLLDNQYFATPFYGYRKIRVWLQKQGFVINEKRVRRLMKLVNWNTIYREPKTTISHPEHKKYPYLLKDLAITDKNQVWATDITYIPMNKGFMYLTAIIDLHTRYVLNWDVSNTMSAEWCAKVLSETIQKHGAPIIFNTDQGSQYTSEAHIKVLKDNNIKISMDGKGRAIDNIFIERLWRSVKYEEVYLQSYSDGVALYKGLEKYFEFYNQQRFHQSLNYQTPSSVYNLSKVA